VLRVLKLIPRQGTPMRAHFRLPDHCFGSRLNYCCNFEVKLRLCGFGSYSFIGASVFPCHTVSKTPCRPQPWILSFCPGQCRAPCGIMPGSLRECGRMGLAPFSPVVSAMRENSRFAMSRFMRTQAARCWYESCMVGWEGPWLSSTLDPSWQ